MLILHTTGTNIFHQQAVFTLSPLQQRSLRKIWARNGHVLSSCWRLNISTLSLHEQVHTFKLCGPCWLMICKKDILRLPADERLLLRLNSSVTYCVFASVGVKRSILRSEEGFMTYCYTDVRHFDFHPADRVSKRCEQQASSDGNKILCIMISSEPVVM